jgi:hypothetical protein
MTSDMSADDGFGLWFDHKSALLESMLGKEHNMVMHALIPYSIGGALDLYYYPNRLPGTAIATKELTPKPNEGSHNDVYRSYELVMFTRYPIDLEAAKDVATGFGRAHSSINHILNCVGPYSAKAIMNPMQTGEVPRAKAGGQNNCLIFDEFACRSDDVVERFGLLILIEIFRSEMEFAREYGGRKLIHRLKAKGYYPYSDLDRKPVV